MKAIFGVLSLLIVLAVAALLAKQQLPGIGSGVSARAASQATASADSGRRGAGDGSPAGAIVADPAAVQQLSRDLQQRARDDTTRALQQGAERNRRAEP